MNHETETETAAFAFMATEPDAPVAPTAAPKRRGSAEPSEDPWSRLAAECPDGLSVRDHQAGGLGHFQAWGQPVRCATHAPTPVEHPTNPGLPCIWYRTLTFAIVADFSPSAAWMFGAPGNDVEVSR